MDERNGPASASAPSSSSTGSGASGGAGTGASGGSATGGNAGSAGCTTVWAKSFGTDGADSILPPVTTSNGHLLLAGLSEGPIDFGGGALDGPGMIDMFVAELEGTSAHVWSKLFSSASETVSPYALARDAANNVYAVGLFSGAVDFGGGPLSNDGGVDAFVVKLDATGNHLWSQSFEQNEPCTVGCGIDLAVDAAGNVYLALSAPGTVDLGGGPLVSAGGADVFLAQLDAAGMHVWSDRIGGIGADFGTLELDAGGGLLLSGSFRDTVDFGPATLTSAGDADGYVAGLDTSGALLWVEQLSGTSYNGVGGATAAGSNVIVTGIFVGSMTIDGHNLTANGPLAAFAAMLDASHQVLWSTVLDASVWTVSYSAIVDAMGRTILPVTFGGTLQVGGDTLVSSGDYDGLVLALDASGRPHGWCSVSGPETDIVAFLRETPDGLVMAGVFEDTLQLGTRTLTSAGGLDILLAKIDPP